LARLAAVGFVTRRISPLSSKCERRHLDKEILDLYTPKSGDILPTLDIEEDYDNRCSLPVQKRIKQIEKMVQLVSTRLRGRKPMIYTKALVWSELGNPAQFSDCPLWVVDYHSTNEPVLPRRGRDLAFGNMQKISPAMASMEHTTGTILMGPRRTCVHTFYKHFPKRKA
jgi:hypothetical protein